MVAALGAPAEAVVLFELLLNASSLFNHANLHLPPRVDRLLRLVVVTPDMHRVHHSVHPDEHHRNFGFALAIWDRLFGTYRAQPRAGHEGMVVGLRIFREPAEQRLDRLLTQPFRRPDAPSPGLLGEGDGTRREKAMRAHAQPPKPQSAAGRP